MIRVVRSILLVFAATCFLILPSVLFALPSSDAAPLAASSLVPSDASSTQLSFIVNLIDLNGFTFDISFAPTLGLTGGSVTAGQNVNATATLDAPPSAELNIIYDGKQVSLPFNPLGSLYEAPIPGLSYSYLGVQLGLFLNTSGTVLGSTAVAGPASDASPGISWTGSASDAVHLSIWSNASGGSTITWSVENIEYGLSLGIDAVGTVLGIGITIPLIDFGSVGVFPSYPSSASATYTLPSNSGGISSLSSLITGAELAGAGSAIAIVSVVLVAAVVMRRRNLRKGTTPKTN